MTELINMLIRKVATFTSMSTKLDFPEKLEHLREPASEVLRVPQTLIILRN